MIFEEGRLRLGPAGAVSGCGDGKGVRRVLAGPRLWKADRNVDLQLILGKLRWPLPEHDTHPGPVQQGELQGAPGTLGDPGEVGVEQVGPPGGDVLVDPVDVVGLDGDLRPVLGGIFRTFHDVGLRAIPAHHGQGGVLVEHGEAQAIHEKVESFIHVIEEDLGNESEHHRGGI